MNYTIIGKPLRDTWEKERETRDEAITATLEAHLTGRETVIRVADGWDSSELICDGVYAWADLGDMIDRLAIKEGVDLVRFDSGNIGLVAYYGSHKSYLEILEDPAEVARVREEDDE